METPKAKRNLTLSVRLAWMKFVLDSKTLGTNILEFQFVYVGKP